MSTHDAKSPEQTTDLRTIFETAGAFEKFSCAYCDARDNFVSGPHSHTCSRCGGHATYGWYTTPLCARCQNAT